MSDEQAEKAYNRALRLEQDFVQYFTGKNKLPQLLKHLSSFRSHMTPIPKRIFLHKRTALYCLHIFWESLASNLQASRQILSSLRLCKIHDELTLFFQLSTAIFTWKNLKSNYLEEHEVSGKRLVELPRR